LPQRPPGESGPPDGEPRKPRSAGDGSLPAARRKPPAPKPSEPVDNGSVPAASRKPPAPKPSEPVDNGASGEPEDSEERQAKAPWHFKVIVVGSVIYLGWRLYQGIGWLAHHL